MSSGAQTNAAAAPDSQATRSAGIDAIKGLLIIAVLIGHNEVFTTHFPELRRFLYYFHTQCFLFLAWALDRAPASVSLIRDRAVRYLVPYSMFALAAAFLSRLVMGEPPGAHPKLVGFCVALLSGNETLLRAAVGMRVFWFLPTLYSLVILRAVATISPRAQNLVAIGSVVWILTVGRIPQTMYEATPLGLPIALFFAVPCMLAKYLFSNMTDAGNTLARHAILASVVGLLSALALGEFATGRVNASQIASYFSHGLTACAIGIGAALMAFMALVGLQQYLLRVPGLALLGRYSLQIYLLHMFVYRGLTWLCFGREFTATTTTARSLPLGIGILLMTVLTSASVAFVCERLPRLNAIVFPRDWADWARALAPCQPYRSHASRQSIKSR